MNDYVTRALDPGSAPAFRRAGDPGRGRRGGGKATIGA